MGEPPPRHAHPGILGVRSSEDLGLWAGGCFLGESAQGVLVCMALSLVAIGVGSQSPPCRRKGEDLKRWVDVEAKSVDSFAEFTKSVWICDHGMFTV